jgi:hypothetical protein
VEGGAFFDRAVGLLSMQFKIRLCCKDLRIVQMVELSGDLRITCNADANKMLVACDFGDASH